MREELGKYHGEYIEIEAEYLHLATTGGKANLLFRNVIHNEEVITDHVWISMQVVRNLKKVKEAKLKKHTVYKMRGKVYLYKKFSKEANKMVYDYCFKSVRIEVEG